MWALALNAIISLGSILPKLFELISQGWDAYKKYKKEQEQKKIDEFYRKKNEYRSDLLFKLSNAKTAEEKVEILKKLDNLGRVTSTDDINKL
jgi:hypothetical protein